MKRLFAVLLVSFSYLLSNAQVGIVNDCRYFFGLRPVAGYFSGVSDISHGVNPNQDLHSSGFVYGIDLVNSTWTYVEDHYLVPQVQVPIYLRYMQSGNRGLQLSDGTVMPESEGAAFSYLNLGMKFFFSPVYFKMGDVVLTPKLGFGLDMLRHKYDLNLNSYLGKIATNSDLTNQINAISPVEPVYKTVFWGDVAGVNLGSYLNVGEQFIFDFDWDFYPKAIINHDAGNYLENEYGKQSQLQYLKGTKLIRYCVEGRWCFLTNVSAFLRYESADYTFETENGINTNGAVILDKKSFHQTDYNVLFGFDVIFM